MPGKKKKDGAEPKKRIPDSYKEKLIDLVLPSLVDRVYTITPHNVSSFVYMVLLHLVQEQ